MITLNNGGYIAEILPERGGNCIRLSKNGVEALRTPKNPDTFQTENPYLYGMPILFFPNRISGGQFAFDGRTYTLPVNEPATGCFLHGTLHETPFDIVSVTQETAVLRYTAATDAPYLTFPHAFTLDLKYTLSENGLHQQVTFRNDSDTNMPVALAHHTTFRIPFVSGGKAENVRLMLDTAEEYGRNMANYLPDGTKEQNHPLQAMLDAGTLCPADHTISRLYRMGCKHTMKLCDAVSGATVCYTAGDTYGYWMVYNGGNRDFICVEPQSWLSNAPNAPFDRSETGFDYLVPRETRTYDTQLSIL